MLSEFLISIVHNIFIIYQSLFLKFMQFLFRLRLLIKKTIPVSKTSLGFCFVNALHSVSVYRRELENYRTGEL